MSFEKFAPAIKNATNSAELAAAVNAVCKRYKAPQVGGTLEQLSDACSLRANLATYRSNAYELYQLGADMCNILARKGAN